MADCRRKQKLGPDYEIGPVSFSESFVPEEVPDFIRADSNYRTLTWILVKMCTVKFVRSKIKAGAVQWPLVETIMENRSAILQSVQDFARDYEAVMGYLNQFTKNYASLTVLISAYNYPAYETWILANNGLEAEFDRAIYHYTGWQICKSV